MREPKPLAHYEYHTYFRQISALVQLAILLAVLFLFGRPLTGVLWDGQTTLAEAGLSLERIWLVTAVGLPLMLLFVLALHIMYPAIEVSERGFRLQAGFYHSKWIPWKAIRLIHIPTTKGFSQVATLLVPSLPLMFWLVPLAQGQFGRGFLIHPRIKNANRLLHFIYRRRPDLFPNIPKN